MNCLQIIRRKILNDKRLKMIFFALLSLTLNIAYAIYDAYLGISTNSYWFITMSFYYVLLGIMRFNAVYTGAKIEKYSVENKIAVELSVMKRNGIILLFMILALSGTVVLTVNQIHIIAYDTIPMITIATFTFYKIITAIINLVKVKKHNSPLLSTIRNISLADASMSILPMQTSMICSFENQSAISIQFMTIFTGTAISILFFFLGISMIKNGTT